MRIRGNFATVSSSLKAFLTLRSSSGRAYRAPEHQVVLLPAAARFQSLLLLLRAVSLESGDGHRRQRHRASTLLALGLAEYQLLVDALQCLLNRKRALLQVDVLPSEAEGLTQPETNGQRDGRTARQAGGRLPPSNRAFACFTSNVAA
jgi:hypothetical protein